MRRLNDHELENLSLEKAYEIVRDFGKFIEQAIPIYAFEGELPWEKSNILLSLLEALEVTKDAETRDILHYGILFLNDMIPSPEQYAERRQAAEKLKLVYKDLKKGLTKDEIIDKYRID